MSSYGAFITASGFTLNEPNGKIGFAPKITPENFRSAFITGSSWGTFSQNVKNGQQRARLEIEYGALKLKEVSLDELSDSKHVMVTLNGEKVKAKLKNKNNEVMVSFKPISIIKGDKLEFEIK
ncbi:hypothetical protein [Arenibacter certesii]|uniref:Uncharacterized protein n=1 Tax=Arenibacter certesii TaxID=228955 RepID=A0A918MP86_9FLAO|nr:hypothetical protein [Arenibacter certesii]GGW45811.1 hypothetical protein GCM10007383_32630 [Arenibacter certesii]